MRMSKSLITSGNPCPHQQCPRSLPRWITRSSPSTADHSGSSVIAGRGVERGPRPASRPRDPPRRVGDRAARCVRGPDRGARSFAAIAEYAHDTGRTILDTLGVGAVVPGARTDRQLNHARPMTNATEDRLPTQQPPGRWIQVEAGVPRPVVRAVVGTGRDQVREPAVAGTSPPIGSGCADAMGHGRRTPFHS